MGLKNRLLEPMDVSQRFVLITVLIVPLIIQVSTELYYFRYYYPRSLHIAMLIACIVLFLNPKGVRLLLFCFFTYLLMNIFIEGRSQDNTMVYAFPYCLFGLPLFWLGLSMKVILYVHIGLSGLLAYFSFSNPFKSKKVTDVEIIDQN